MVPSIRTEYVTLQRIKTFRASDEQPYIAIVSYETFHNDRVYTQQGSSMRIKSLCLRKSAEIH